MSGYDLFMGKCNALAELLSQKPYAPIPDKIWEKQARALDKLIGSIAPYYAVPKIPTAADIRAVKAHDMTVRIKTFIKTDRQKQAFFTVGYFSQKCASLPDRGLVQALTKGTTKEAYITAFLAYHYWKARPDESLGLENACKEIESDYNNSPANRQTERAKALFRSLLGESDLQRVIAILQDEFPDKEAISGFAKAVKLKISAGKKPIHERVASKILKSGEIVRAKF